jgi:hypothetical protein
MIELELPTPHEKQQYLLDNRKRFNVLKCGRRFGKTELCQELICESFENGQYIGYFSPTYKDLYEVWKTTLNNFYSVIESKSETVKQIIFINGAKVDFWSMEEPNSGRGRKYHRAIMDECEKALKFQEAWEQAISPTLADYKGDAYFLSTPQFGDTYFKQLCKQENIQPDLWKTFVYSTYDNPYIDKNEIDLMRSILPPIVFQCEYLAEDVDNKSVNPFLYALNTDVHFDKSIQLDLKKQLIIGIDFNINPFSVVFCNIFRDQRGLHVNFANEISIENGSLQSMAQRIKALYGPQLINCKMTGDAMGNNRNISLADNASNYETLRRLLGLRQGQIIVPSNPTHETSRNDYNYLLHISQDPSNLINFKVNNENCPGLSNDMRLVQCDNYGDIIKIRKANRNDSTQKADFLDCSRYIINTFVKPEIERHQKSSFINLKYK